MNRFYASFFFFIALTSVVSATSYYSVNGQSPNSLTSWWTNTNGTGSNPSSFTLGHVFIIQFGHSMTTTAPWTVSGTNAEIVLNGGSLTFAHNSSTERLTISVGDVTVNSGVTITVNNGNPVGDDLIVNDILNNAGTIVFGSSANGKVSNTGKYSHTSNGGNIPPFIWTVFSTCKISGVTTTLPGGLGQGFGNILYDCPSQTTNVTINPVPTTLANFTINSTGTSSSLILGASISPSTSLKINGGIFDLSSFTANGLSLADSIVVGAGAKLRIGGTNSFPINYFGHVLDANSTVEYYGSGVQTIAAEKYGNLSISGTRTGSVSLSSTDTIGIAGLFNLPVTFTAGSFIATSSIIEFDGVSTQSIPLLPGAASYHTIIVNKNSGSINANSAIILSGNLELVQGYFYDNGNVVTVNGNMLGKTGIHSTISGGKILLTAGSSQHQVGGGVTLDKLEIDDVLGASTIGSATIKNLILKNGIFKLNHTLHIPPFGTIFATLGNLNATNEVIFDGDGIVTGTVSFDSVQINGSVDFGSGSTINGALTINAGGMIVTNSPTFANGSTLIYSSGGVFNRGLEWNATSGAGYPYNVKISNYTEVNLGANGGTGTSRQIAGDLNIDLGSKLRMNQTGNEMLAPLTVLGNFTLNGWFIQSSLAGNDFYLGGNWVQGDASSSFSPNGRTVHFVGNGEQIISRANFNSVDFSSLTVNKPSGNLVIDSVMATSLTIDDTLSVISGDINLKDRSINFQFSTSLLNVTNVPHTIFGSPGAMFQFNTTKTMNSIGGGTLIFNENVLVILNGSNVHFGNGITTINGVLEITGGTVALGGAPIYGPASLLRYNIDGLYNRGEEWSSTVSAGYPHSVELINATSLNLGGNGGTTTPRQIAGDLIVGSSSLLSMNEIGYEMSAPLIVMGNANIYGSLALSSLYGGDLKLGGNFSVTTGSNIIHNNRTVWFIGSAMQSISETTLSLLQLGGMRIENSSNNVLLNCGLEISDTLSMFGGNILTDLNYVKILSIGTVERVSGAVVGNLKKEFPVGTNISKRFEVSDGKTYSPLDITFANISTAGYLTAHADSLVPVLTGSPINPSKKVSKFWTVSDNGIVFDTYDVTFNFTSMDVDSGSDFNKFIIGRTFDAIWVTPVVGTKTDSSTQMVGSHLFGTFAVGETQTNTITASIIGDGTLLPLGISNYNLGDTANYFFTPNSGSHFDSLLVDGIKVDSASSYTFINVTAVHTIDAYFSLNVFHHFIVQNSDGNPINPQTAGQNFSIVTTAVDSFGNPVVSFTGNVWFSSTDSTMSVAGGNFSIPFINGQHGPQIVSLYRAGLQTITVIDSLSGKTGTSVPFLINPSGLSYFAVKDTSGLDVPQQVQSFSFPIKIIAVDAYGNIQSNYCGSVDVSVSGGAIVTQGSGATPNFNNGILSSHVMEIGSSGFYGINVSDNTAERIGASNFFLVVPNSNSIFSTCANGIITPAGATSVNYGDTITYSFSPNAKHHFDSVYVDGVRVIDSTLHYTFVNVITTHLIDVFNSANLNIAPMFTSVLSDTAIARFDTLYFQYQAFDPDSGTIGYTLLNSPSGAVIDSTGLLKFIPAANANGISSVVVQVNDDSLAFVYDTVKVRVNIYGDVSGNGTISSFDASLVLQNTVSANIFTALQERIGDVSGNGGISALDASYLLQYSVGLILSFPGGLGKQQHSEAVLSAFSFRIEKSKEADEYDLYIAVNKPSLVYSVTMDLGFDSTVVIPKSFTKTTMTDSMSMASKFFTEEVKLSMAGINPLNKAGDVIKFTFMLKDPNYPKNALLFTVKKFILNEIDHTNEIGGITLNVRNLAQLPTEYKLEQNFPNPFNPTTTINYQLPDASSVKIVIYNMLGQEVKTLITELQSAGYYSLVWNGTDNTTRKVSSGVYIYRITASKPQNKQFSEVKKMMMIK